MHLAEEKKEKDEIVRKEKMEAEAEQTK